MRAGNAMVLGLVGSPNREGRTFQTVSAALDGAAKAGAQVELVQLADHAVAACKDCEPWTCMDDLKCAYSDAGFEYLAGKLLGCGALVLGTPIYWSDTSAILRLLILKMFRVFARSGRLGGLPAVGIGVAGGTGNGLVSGLRPIYHFFSVLQMRALDPVPATRFNWDWAISQAEERGTVLASMADERHPFTCLEERLLWYDGLPYLSMSRSAERRLLAALTTAAACDAAPAGIACLLAEAERLAVTGETLESLKITTSIYDATAKAFESTQEQ
jgi:multimeric flavodoxin WrbA